LRGRLNIVQELALRASIKSERDIEQEKEKAAFKLELFKNLIATHAPKHAWAIVDGEMDTEEDDPEVTELGNEDGSFSADDINLIQEQIAQFNLKGYAVEEV
jgi:hypothetical protein